MSKRINPARALAVLRYDPETGLIFWRVDIRAGKNNWLLKAVAGDQAGFASGYGYWVLSIDGARTSAHRFAWLAMTGAWPEHDIDHVDGDRTNNRWTNLRGATRAQNMQNLKGAHKDSSTGLLGVERKRDRFAARICVDGKKHSLGVFATPELAHAAYLKAKREMHERNTL